MVATQPPASDAPQGYASSPSVQPEISETQRAAEALQLEFQSEELRQEKALNSLELSDRSRQSRLYDAQAGLEETYLKRQADVVRTKPVSCPHGSEVRLYPDGTPYCRDKSGAVTFGNVFVEPAAATLKEAVPLAINTYLAQQGIVPKPKVASVPQPKPRAPVAIMPGVEQTRSVIWDDRDIDIRKRVA